jgi:WD40 repeat protein
MLASGSDDSTVRLWDPNSGRELRILSDHPDLVQCVAFSHDGRMLASGLWGYTVRLWAIRE